MMERMSEADLRAHAEGGAGVEPMLATEVLKLRAFIADLAEECARCKAAGRMVMVSYIEKRLDALRGEPCDFSLAKARGEAEAKGCARGLHLKAKRDGNGIVCEACGFRVRA